MAKNRNTIQEIRNTLAPYKGKRVKLYVIGERNRILDTHGILDGLYPDVFTVVVGTGEYDKRYSYTYREILTHHVSVTPLGDCVS